MRLHVVWSGLVGVGLAEAKRSEQGCRRGRRFFEAGHSVRPSWMSVSPTGGFQDDRPPIDRQFWERSWEAPLPACGSR